MIRVSINDKMPASRTTWRVSVVPPIADLVEDLGYFAVLEKTGRRHFVVCGLFPAESLAHGYIGSCWEPDDRDNLIIIGA